MIDPFVMGWVMQGVYLVCVVLCVIASRRRQFDMVRRRPVDRNPASVWILLAILLFVLGINKQHDLQSLLIGIGRELANHQGWYDYRDQLQLIYVFALALAGVVISVLALYWMRHANLAVKWALLGLFLLLCSTLMPASSLQTADTPLGFEVGGIRINTFLELGGLGLIAIAALVSMFIPRKPEYRNIRL